MRINSKSILAGMALGALLLTGCNDAEYDTLSNQAISCKPTPTPIVR